MSMLSDSNVHAGHPQRLAELRRQAAARLAVAATPKGPTDLAVDALSVLHDLASSPATAADALKLLHELQVHQVEVDLQAQELQESRAELEAALRRQVELYDCQPMACFTIDALMVISELNQAGADLLGTARDEVPGLSIGAFVGPESTRRFRSAIAGVNAGQQRASCQLWLRPRQGTELRVLASIGKDPAATRYLVSMASIGDEPEDRAAAR